MKKPFTIGIAGAHSKAGKTTLAVTLLKYLIQQQKIATEEDPVTQRQRDTERWGAIKYTKTAFYSSIVDDKTIINQKGKDTKRFLDAGAEDVLWVQSPAEKLKEVLPIAVNRLSHLDGIIIEGNSAIEFLRPDIVIFLLRVSTKKIKPSAQTILTQADIIVDYDHFDVVAAQKLTAQVNSLRGKRKTEDQSLKRTR